MARTLGASSVSTSLRRSGFTCDMLLSLEFTDSL